MTLTPSTSVLTDLATVAAQAPTAATRAKALATPELDYLGMIAAARAALSQARYSLALVAAATDAADTNTATIADILATLS
jgi:hypothetical protein